eukprot:CAMPEP_0178932740 /NCGR_PEP_ID=MMETSP0786-20121207/22817_1 /TAXON_ID=186022 /ORGANISM="Thalassionema frauenfeldii, Strain CCMP 1798" /LENGTH=447 /DNA_ID=CAMNT_0020610129 /DNA_START=90 /DNA_END=1433 /DNA_ORIENTATION=-
MKLSQAVIVITTLRTAVSFHHHPTSQASFRLKSSSDDSFAAFAQELEEEPPQEQETTTTTTPWQAKLETLLDPRTSLAERQILASELMTDNQNDIRESVVTAVQERKIDPLLTPTGKRLQDGTRAVARQLTNDIIPKVIPSSNTNPPDLVEDVFSLLPKLGNRFVKTMQSQAMKQFQELQNDLSDPVTKIPQRLSQQSKFVQTEVSNIFSEVPQGLNGPKYTVVETTDDYEIRDYEAYTVASVTMGNTHGDFSLEDMAEGGAAFNTLAGYLFGGNVDGTNMEMTTPVTTTSLGEMRFYLTSDESYPTFPEPLNETTDDDDPPVTLLQIPASRLAVRRFTGFVTDGEVSRQKQVLLEQLDLDGHNSDIDVPHGHIVPHVIFQYNPPYTLPVVRRNEIGIPMNRPASSSSSFKAEYDDDDDEWLTTSSSSNSVTAEEEEIGDDVSPSDY